MTQGPFVTIEPMDDYDKMVEKVGDRSLFNKQVSLGIRDTLAMLETQHKVREIRRGGGKPSKHRWTTRTGEASRSFHRDWKKDGLVGSYGTDLFRALVLERGSQEALGGPIRPKRSKYLAIPTSNVPRGAKPRDIPDLFFIQSLRGQPLLATGQSNDDLRIMFVLRRQVTIPPRRGLDRAWKKTAKKRAARMQLAIDRGTGKKE